MLQKRSWLVASLLLVLVSAAPVAQSQGRFTPPTFGPYTVGDDYFLGNYAQLQAYFAKLDQESDRMKVVEVGKTAEGRPMIMAIITSPENHKKLDRYRDISRRLARAEDLTDDQARALAAEGKAVVWIDGGLHATETVNAQELFLMAYQMVSQNDPETLRFLNDVILLLTPANPDGMDLVSNWYMREPDPRKRSTAAIPRLYQKYVGHDNNRDSYIANQPETEAINRLLYIDWIPQIMYNQHQTGPVGAVLFVPPFRDPFNYNEDPLVPMGIDLVSASIHNRFVTEGKGGAAMRSEAAYSTWYNGGERTTAGFHNQIGILTEIKGDPTPIEIPLVLDRQLPHQDLPLPLPPQKVWHFRQSIDYIISANRAILDVASKHREDFLFRIYRMGRNSIDRGSSDYWTLQPQWIEQAKAAAAKEAAGSAATRSGRGGETRVGEGVPVPMKYWDLMRTPERRDPRGYIVPADQADFITATKFVNALIKAGVVVHRATGPFQVAGKTYPGGSYVVKAAQAFRPHLRDMFEPQDHPNDFFYPGGPPKPPYDVTGYTLAFQMGVKFDRIIDAFDGPFEALPLTPLKPVPGKVTAAAKPAVGYLLDHRVTDAFVATTRLLGAKEEVYWLKAPFAVGGKTYPAGTIYVPNRPTTRPFVERLAADLGLTFETTAVKPAGDAFKLRPMRVALWDQYGGSMPSGWIRWMFEQAFPLAFDVIYPPALDAGNLAAKYDVIIFPTGAIPLVDGAAGRESRDEGSAPADLPAEFKDRVGSVTVATTVPQLRKFVEDGGTIVAIGSSTNIAYHLGLPVTSALVDTTAAGVERPLTGDKFYVPGSVLQASVDPTNPLAYGFDETADMMFDRSPAFRLGPDAPLRGVRPVAWFPTSRPLKSGWAWGQHYLKGTIIAVDATLGKGKVCLLAPEITFRGQPHGTFKFLFNAIYYGGAHVVNVAQAGTAIR
ncbi:MAG: M14 family metallopeptidase [Acidobacteria bacterium]|nr:M14 family metallopeptidase [Acidobacteriota bacterium]